MRRLLCLFAALAASPPAHAQPAAGPDSKDVRAVLDKAYDFLKARQRPDGGFEPVKAGGPGPTALIAAALIRLGKPVDDPVIAKALAYLEKYVQKDGGIYTNPNLANYTTAIALVAFKEANRGGKYDAIIANAAKLLKSLQHGGPDGETPFGGFGYNAKMRPDTSNSHFSVEALLATLPKDDPSVKNALIFLSKCQNLPGEANKLEYAKKTTEADRGGFVYNPFDATDEKSEKRTPEGGLRSEGGMTYAGLKSFLYAGVGKDDPRVKAAIDWIRRHYTLEENPGQKDVGLFYYYHVFAKAMDALGEDLFEDAKGVKHDWRKELFETLRARQSADGSWVNKNGRFLENSPELATSFALLALSYTTKK